MGQTIFEMRGNNAMTIKELYQWAKKEHKEDFTIVIRVNEFDPPSAEDFFEPTIDDLFIWESTRQVEI